MKAGAPWVQHEGRGDRQDWVTPWALFWEVERRWGRCDFTIDPCGDWWNAKCGAPILDIATVRELAGGDPVLPVPVERRVGGHNVIERELWPVVDLARIGANEIGVGDIACPWRRGTFLDAGADGLAQSWAQPNGRPGRAFVNPPFDSIGEWVRKAWLELQRGHVEVVALLLPTRRDQQWYHRVVRPHAAHVEDLEGRLHFDPPVGSAGKSSGGFEPMMVVVLEHRLVAGEFHGKHGRRMPDHVRAWMTGV